MVELYVDLVYYVDVGGIKSGLMVMLLMLDDVESTFRYMV
jgi:hypothetical protein